MSFSSVRDSDGSIRRMRFLGRPPANRSGKILPEWCGVGSVGLGGFRFTKSFWGLSYHNKKLLWKKRFLWHLLTINFTFLFDFSSLFFAEQVPETSGKK